MSCSGMRKVWELMTPERVVTVIIVFRDSSKLKVVRKIIDNIQKEHNDIIKEIHVFPEVIM